MDGKANEPHSHGQSIRSPYGIDTRSSIPTKAWTCKPFATQALPKLFRHPPCIAGKQRSPESSNSEEELHKKLSQVTCPHGTYSACHSMRLAGFEYDQ